MDPGFHGIDRVDEIEVRAGHRGLEVCRGCVCRHCCDCAVEQTDRPDEHLVACGKGYRRCRAGVEIRFGIGHHQFRKAHGFEQISLAHDAAECARIEV